MSDTSLRFPELSCHTGKRTVYWMAYLWPTSLEYHLAFFLFVLMTACLLKIIPPSHASTLVPSPPVFLSFSFLASLLPKTFPLILLNTVCAKLLSLPLVLDLRKQGYQKCLIKTPVSCSQILTQEKKNCLFNWLGKGDIIFASVGKLFLQSNSFPQSNEGWTAHLVWKGHLKALT